jgi:beta-glucosidase
VNPGGKLPVTFPRSVGQLPLYYNHKNTGRPPDANNKYTSKYLDVPWTPLFPFGYGLSYTQFKFSNLQLSAQRIRPDGSLTVAVVIENLGQRAGDEVAQLYIRDFNASRFNQARRKRFNSNLRRANLAFMTAKCALWLSPARSKSWLVPAQRI